MFPASEEVFASITELCSGDFFIFKSSPTEEALLRLGNGLGRDFLGRDWPYKSSELRD